MSVIIDWWRANLPKEEMRYRQAASEQIIEFEFLECLEGFSLDVVSTHRSKSIVLPVVELRWEGFVFTLRDNFHDVTMSVSSPVPVDISFAGGVVPLVMADYFQGFPHDRIYAGYNGTGQREFSIQFWNMSFVHVFIGMFTQWYRDKQRYEKIITSTGHHSAK